MRFSNTVASLGIVLATLFFCQAASADSPDASQPTDPWITIPRGTWTFESYGSFAGQPTGNREQLYSGTLGLGYYFLPSNSLTWEFTGLYGSQAGPDVAAGGTNFLFRTHLLTQRNWSLLIDFGAGIFQADSRIPATGSDFNFTFKTGFGGTIHLFGDTSLLTGIRYEHLSNARLYGEERNPSLNAIEGYVGILIKL
jgi:hypothetical protein